MINTQDSIVKKAAEYFTRGDYRAAKECYSQAANRYGQHLFAANIRLCDLYLFAGQQLTPIQTFEHLSRHLALRRNCKPNTGLRPSSVVRTLENVDVLRAPLSSPVTTSDGQEKSLTPIRSAAGTALRSASHVDFATAKQWFYRQGILNDTFRALESLQASGEMFDKGKRDFHAFVAGMVRLREGWKLPPRQPNAGLMTRPQHILYCLHQSVPHTTNGYATRSHGVAVALQQAGFNVRATTRPGFPWDAGTEGINKGYHEVEVDGVTYAACAGWNLSRTPLDYYMAEAADHYLREAQTSGAEIIVAASNHITGLPALMAARRLGIPFVYEVRGLWEVTQASIQPEWAGSERYQLMRELEQQAALEADLVITLTEELADELASWGVPRERIEVVPNAVNAERFQPMAADAAIAKELKLKPGVPVIGYAGSAVAYEGLELLMEAMATLKKNGQAFTFVLVGDDKVIDTVKAKAKELGIERECRFTGRVPFEEVPRYLSCMDILPIPRLSSAVTEMVSALKPLEAMAMGKALVLSDVSPHTTMAGPNGERARLFTKDSAQALSDALQALIDSPEERARLGQAARAWIEQERTWNHVTRRYADALQHVRRNRAAEVAKAALASGKNDAKRLEQITLGLIADQFTTDTLASAVNVVPLSPENWREELAKQPIDAMFVESAWKGNDWQRSLKLPAPKPTTELLFSAHTEPMVWALKGETEQKRGGHEPVAVTALKPQADTITKIDEREIRKEQVNGVTTYTFPVAGRRLVVELEVVSELPYAHNQVVAGIELKDSGGGLVESESYRLFNYSRSAKYGRYKYLSANSGGSKYTLTLEIPEAASQCVVNLGFRRGAKVTMACEPSFSFCTGKLESEIEKGIIGLAASGSPEEVGQLLKRVGFNVSYATAVAKAIESLPMTTKLVADAFWYLWHLTNDPALFEIARQRLVFQGRMYETKQLLNEWDASANFKNGKNSARRVEDEISLLENGMPMPERRSSPAYAPTGNVLYLLHNRLPYNSGGYATRTHGLLTGIVKNSSFKMHGVSRPGYPSDHAKHISKPLPKNIPRVDVVDGVEYFALDQKIRRSSLTMTEYVEAYAKEVEALAIEKKASVIHAAANFPNGLAASLAARRLGIKSVYEVRGLWEITRLSRQEGWDETDQFRFMAKMEAEACNAADAVITITEALKELMVSRGVDASKITVAPNCVHTDLFSPLEKDQKLAKELGISDEDTVIGYIGSIVNYEGLDDLLEALALLVQDGVTNFKFLLVGDGAVLNELKQQVVELGLQSYVVITGRVPHEEVQRYYSLVDITPFPRKPYLVCEAVSPLKPFEAMASQKAVIVSSCAALTEIIKDGENGLVFEKGNIFSFRDAIKKLIADDGLRSTLAINGRDWVTRERDWKNSSSIVSKVYSGLTEVEA